MSQIDDVEAIHQYMLVTPSKTSAAETIRVNFLSWFEKAGFWDKNMSNTWYDEARSRRNAFNLANATTAAETAKVTQVITKGMTTEEMQGKAKPAIDKKTGAVGSQAKKLTTPLSSNGQPVLTRVLKQGMNGEDVKTWQSFLGLTPPTGYFDATTTAKTKAFQSSKKLTTDGQVGQKSWAAAFPVVAAQITPSPNDTTDMFARPATPDFAKPSTSGGGAAPKPAPAPGPAPAPAPGPKPASGSASTPSAKVQAAAVKTAGMLGNLSTGEKIGAGVAAVVIVAGTVFGHHGGVPAKPHHHR